MKKASLIIGIILMVLLLAPYLGINVLGSNGPAPRPERAAPAQISTDRSQQAPAGSEKRLNEIERMLE